MVSYPLNVKKNTYKYTWNIDMNINQKQFNYEKNITL